MCDKLKEIFILEGYYTENSPSPLFGDCLGYEKLEVDKAIAEKDAEIAQWKDKFHDLDNQWNEQTKEIAELKTELEDAKERAELWYEENKELRQKLHDAEMRADLAEAAETERKIDYEKLRKEHRQTLRALWLARSV